MTFYSEMAATALSMLTEFGQNVTLRKYSVGGSTYDPTTGIASPLGTTGAYDATRKGLQTDQPGNRIAQQFGQTLQNGSLVQSADKWLYLDANGDAPQLQDHLIISGTEYVIIDVQVTNPGGVALLYLLVLRS